MKRYLMMAAITTFALGFPHCALAAVTVGPFRDFQGSVEPSAIEVENTRFLRDYVVWQDDLGVGSALSSPRDVAGAAFLSYAGSDFSGDVRVTTFYGIDLNPTGPELLITGFDPADALQLTFTGETIYGNSGTGYHADFSAMPQLSELPTMFPGFDFSLFQGNPSSVLFAFQTTVPGDDVPIPEPSAAALAIVGCLGFLARAHHVRKYLPGP